MTFAFWVGPSSPRSYQTPIHYSFLASTATVDVNEYLLDNHRLELALNRGRLLELLLWVLYFAFGVTWQLTAIVLRYVHTLTSQLIDVKDAEFGIVRGRAEVCWWLLVDEILVASFGLFGAIDSAVLTRYGIVDDF